MNDEQLIWESYTDNAFLLESLDKIQYYPFDKSFSFHEIYNRASEDDIMTKNVSAFFNNKAGDTVHTIVRFTDNDHPVMRIDFYIKDDNYEINLTKSGDAVNVIATVLKIGIEAYSAFRNVMMNKHPKLWDSYLASHRGVVAAFVSEPTENEDKHNSDNKQFKRGRLYKVVFDRLIKQLCTEYKLPDMSIEVRNKTSSFIRTVEKPTGMWGRAQDIPVIGKLF